MSKWLKRLVTKHKAVTNDLNNKAVNKESDKSFVGKILIRFTKPLVTFFVWLISWFIAVISLYGLLMLVIITVVAIAAGIIIDAISATLRGLDPSGLGGCSAQTQTVGEQYIWNETDLAKMPDEWSKNLYRLGWIITANKEAQKSNVPVNLMLGLPAAETGPNFFPAGDDHGAGSITGKGKNWNNYSIANYATVGGDFPWTLESDYITGLYAQDASNFKVIMTKVKPVWGVTHTSLDTSCLGQRHLGYLKTYANNNPDYSVYSVAASTAATIYMYDSKANYSFENDADKGYAHAYKKYWETACAKYDIDPKDEYTRKQVYALMYYLIHGGGTWEYAIADDFGYMAFDYICFVYKIVCLEDVNTISFTSDYKGKSSIRNLSAEQMKSATRGDKNTAHANASVWNAPNITKAYFQRKTEEGIAPINKSIVQLWMEYNTGISTSDSLKLVSDYEKIYLHYNVSLVRQAEYTMSVGIGVLATGNARLDYIFGILDTEYVVDMNTGYVCLKAATDVVGTKISTEGYRSGNFDTVNSKKKGYSNYRDENWFANINTNEWCNPLSNTKNGGFKVTSRYGFRYLSSSNPWDWHSGVDLAYWQSTTNIESLRSMYPVYAMHDGTIVFVNAGATTGGGGGRYLHYKVTYNRNGHSVTRYITYMHLSGFDASIIKGIGNTKKGAVNIPVKKGQVIGYMGGSGDSGEFSYAVHLHVSLSTNPTVNSSVGHLDIETELPFFTSYDNYDSWWVTGGVSGYLKKKPDYFENTSGVDKQSGKG